MGNKPSKPGDAPRRQLGAVGTVKLGGWLTNHAEELANTTAPTALAAAREQLGLPQLTEPMLRGLAKQLGVQFASQRGGARHKSGVDRVYIVARALADLMEHLKYPVPPMLAAVCKRQSTYRPEVEDATSVHKP